MSFILLRKITLEGKQVVKINPNTSNLLYWVNSNEQDQVKFPYTQDTYYKERKVKKHHNYLQVCKKEIIDEKTRSRVGN